MNRIETKHKELTKVVNSWNIFNVQLQLGCNLIVIATVVTIVDKVPRRYDIQDTQSASDKQLVIFDAFERMSGYTYFGVIDHDEFLIPSKNRSLKEMLVCIFYS